MPSPAENGGAPVEFGKYRLQRLIGRGGMGEVYLATLAGEFGFEKRLVVKTILPELASDARFVQLFATEAKTAVMLSHGNIVPIYELGRSEDTFYIAMGYVEGPSVAQLLRSYKASGQRPNPATALFIIREVLTGLAYAHTPERDRPAVVHRDVSPRNVLIDRSGQVQIVDFGIALPAEVEVSARMGSTGYMSPEQARGEAADPRADVFSVGCLLFELLTLERAYPKDSVWSEPSVEALPDDLGPIVAAAISIDPERRPKSAGAFLDALGESMRRHAANFAEHDLARHLREVFPDGWDHVDEPVSAGTTVTPMTHVRASTQTFATRLTPLEPRESATSIAHPANVPPRLRLAWLGLGVVGAIGLGALVWAAADTPSPPPDTAQPKPQVATPRPQPPPDPAGTPAAAARSPVLLRIEPATAKVEVEGMGVLPGSSPYALALDEGESKMVEASADGFESQRFMVEHGTSEREITLQPLGTAKLDIRAPGVNWADVYVDGKKVKGTTPTVVQVQAGPHRVRIKCTDSCEHPRVLLNTQITVKAGEDRIVEP